MFKGGGHALTTVVTVDPTPTMIMTMIRFSGTLEPHLLTTTHIQQVTRASDSKWCHHFENDAQSTAAILTGVLQTRFWGLSQRVVLRVCDYYY